MEKTIIEKFATGAVKDRMLKTGCIDPNIPEGDKEPSWDGHIYLYENGSNFNKSNLKVRIPVQVKGHECENLLEDTIRFDAEVADLRNYSMEGYALYFVVYVAQGGEANRVYYAELTPAKLADLLDDCKPGQKTKRISLKALPEDKDEVADIVREFYDKCIHNEGKRAKFDLPLVSAMTAGSFVGREKELAQIEQELKNGTNPIFLSGFGGMGKTELAVKFGKNYRDSGKGNVYMVSFQGSFYKTLMQVIAPQIPGLQNQPDEKLAYETVLHHLKQWSKDDILIIDNADGNGDDFYALMDDTYNHLLELPCRILITTRCCTPDMPVEVAAMPHTEAEKPLYQLFRNHGVNLAPEKMDALIHAVQGHTMTVDLIARTLKRNRILTPELLIQKLRDGTISEQEYRAVGTTYASREQKKIDGHLRALFKVADVPGETKQMLSCAVLIPQNGMDYETFRDSLPECALDALEEQIDHGWLGFDFDTHILTIHPVIRLVCRIDIEGWKDYCPEFLNKLHEKQKMEEFKLDIYSQLADVYRNAVAEDIPTDRAMWHYLTAWYLWRQGQYQEALDCEIECFRRREAVLEENDPDMAHVCNDLGTLYGHMGDYNSALQYKKRALKIRLEIPDVDQKDLATSYNNVGTTYGDLGDHQKALEYQLKTLAIFEKVLPPEHPDLAQSYNNVGYTYGELGDHQKALEYHQKALAIREKVLPPEHPDLAQSYNNVGLTYGALGDHQKALEYELKALAIREKVLPPEHPDLAQSYNNVGYTYGDLGDHQKALEYKLKALAIWEKVLPPEHPDLALSYNNVARSYYDTAMGCRVPYLRQKNLKTAVQYAQKAVKTAEKSLPSNHPNLLGYKRNLKSLKQAR